MQEMPATAEPPSAPARLAIPAKVGGLIKAAMTALQQSRWAEAVELTAAAAVQDIQHENVTFLASTAGAGIIGELYENALVGAAQQQISRVADRTTEAQSVLPKTQDPRLRTPLRVLYVHPGLSPGQAATDRLVNVIERHDRARVTPLLLCAEEFTARVPALRHLEWPASPSHAHTTALERLKKVGCEPTIIPPLGSYLDSAQAAIDAARSLRPDVAVFIASGACPVQAAMAFSRVAPVQINQNIGSPLISRNIDAVIYRNAGKLRDDAPDLARRGIEGIDLPAAGTDLEAADAAVAVSRSALGIPKDAVVFVTAGNKVPERLHAGTFARDLVEFLKAHPRAWWLAVGRGEYAEALAPFEVAGVRRRVVAAGPQTDIRPHLKAADVYLNEYPEGGSNTVMEAMACGLPVVAARFGDAHAGTIGAELCGIDAATPETYWATAARWCVNVEEREAAAARALTRARDRFGFHALVAQYEDIYMRMASGVNTPSNP